MTETNDDYYSRLSALLSREALKHGDRVELQDRRGLGIVGISVYSSDPSKNASIHTDWMDDLDGMTFEEAFNAALAITYANAEQEDRALNEV